MMKLIFTLVLVFSTFLTLAETEINESVTPEAKIKKFTRTVVYESEMNREDAKYSIGVGMGFDYGAYGRSYNLGYFLDRNNILNVNMVNVDTERGSYSENYSANVISASLQHFTGNSFYVAGSVYGRSAKERQLDNNFDLQNLSYKDMGAGIKIGNQWQWQNFTLGCDWIGLNYSIFKLSSKGNINEAVRLDRAATLLRLYLAVTF